MARVVHFELPADDPHRAIKFYEKAFNWSFEKFAGPQDYWLIKTGEEDEPGIGGGLGRRQDKDHILVNVIGVENVDDAAKAIEDAGGTVTVPKFAIPTVGFVAYFVDPEGNSMGVFHGDATAA